MEDHDKLSLLDNRLFSSDPRQAALAAYLYHRIADLPLISPHSHVSPTLFANEDYHFGDAVDLLILPDHYMFRMLYSQGISLESLGIQSKEGHKVETDHRKIWQTFADHAYLFRGTPTGIWLAHELYSVLGIRQKLTSRTAQAIYDQINERLDSPDMKPRSLYKQFGIEALCTTDAITEKLENHQKIKDSGWEGRILPTFRPDGVIAIRGPEWLTAIQELGQVSGIGINSYANYIQALENRRSYFKKMGAVATDHAVQSPFTCSVTLGEAERIFQSALRGEVSADDAQQFTGHMLVEMARMSVEDGLVMQLHVGSYRDHNPLIYSSFGRDKGADIPVQTEFTYNLRPLLVAFGNDTRLRLVIFALDESNYSRELAPLAGHYPAIRLGPPWWFHDSPNGIRRFLEQVSETAGIYNLAGFNDDTRAFLSIPARHDVWRRVCSDWVAGLIIQGRVDLEDGEAMIEDLTYNLVKNTYRL